MPLTPTSLEGCRIITVSGKVTRIIGLVVEGYCPHSSIGTLCRITPLHNGPPVFAEVVGFQNSKALLMPLGDLRPPCSHRTILVRKISRLT